MSDRTDPSKYLKWNTHRTSWINSIEENHVQQLISYADPKHIATVYDNRRIAARNILKNLSRQSDKVRAYLVSEPLGRDIESEVRNTILSTIKIKTDQDIELERIKKSHLTAREANIPRMLHHFDKKQLDLQTAKNHLLSPKVRK